MAKSRRWAGDRFGAIVGRACKTGVDAHRAADDREQGCRRGRHCEEEKPVAAEAMEAVLWAA